MRALFELGQAAQTVQLGRMPESVDGMNAISLAELLHNRIVTGQLRHTGHVPVEDDEFGESCSGGTVVEGR